MKRNVILGMGMQAMGAQMNANLNLDGVVMRVLVNQIVETDSLLAKNNVTIIIKTFLMAAQMSAL